MPSGIRKVLQFGEKEMTNIELIITKKLMTWDIASREAILQTHVMGGHAFMSTLFVSPGFFSRLHVQRLIFHHVTS